MNIRPYMLLGSQHHKLISSFLEESLDSWKSDWFGQDETISVTQIIEPEQFEDDFAKHGETFLLFSKQSCWVAFANNRVVQEALGRKLLNVDETKPVDVNNNKLILEGLLVQIFQELTMSLIKLLNADQCSDFDVDIVDDLPLEIHLPASGCVLVVLMLADVPIKMTLSSFIVASILELSPDRKLSTEAQLISMTEALTRQTVVGKVRLGTAELNVGELMTLQVGDVLPLEQTLVSPAVLEINKQDACKVFVGKQDGMTAIKILSSV